MLYLILILLQIPTAFADSSRKAQLTCDGAGTLQSFSAGSVDAKFDTLPSRETMIRQYVKNCEEVASCLDILGEHGGSSLTSIAAFLKDSLDKKSDWIEKSKTASNLSTEELNDEMHRLSVSLNRCHSAVKQIDNSRPMTDKLVFKFKDTFHIDYPFKGINRAQRGSNYDSGALRELIRLSIANGVDPYMTIAIKLLEMAPVKTQEYVDYRSMYGVINMDAIAVYDQLGCFEPKSTTRKILSREDQKTVDRYHYKLRELVTKRSDIADKIASSKAGRWHLLVSGFADKEINPTKERFCSREERTSEDEIIKKPFCASNLADEFFAIYKAEKIEHANIEKFETEIVGKTSTNHQEQVRLAIRCGAGCHGRVKANLNDPILNVGLLETSARRFCSDNSLIWVGQNAEILKANADQSGCCGQLMVPAEMTDREAEVQLKGALGIQFLRSIQGNISRQKGDVSAALQRFNGVGCIGCTEGSNECFYHMHASDRPIYGARASDLMLNSVMANESIQKMVAEIRRELQKPVKSIFCQALGVGQHAVSREKYLEEQRKYLLDGPHHQFKTRLSNGNFGIPSTEKEKADYERLEAVRQNACSKYFR